MTSRRLIISLLLGLACLPSLAVAELKPFQKDSLAQIMAAHEGQPFLLLLWSLDCPPCLKELAQLGALDQTLATQRMVLVSTDGPSNRVPAERILRDFGLDQLDNWIFAEDFSERLRYHIDPNWFGELPRAYFYTANHQRIAKSGVLPPELFQRWLQWHSVQGS